MKVDKDQFDTLLGRLMQTPPQEGQTIKGHPGNKARIVPLFTHQLRVRHRLKSDHAAQCRNKPVFLLARIEARLKHTQVAVQMLYRNLVEAAYDGSLEGGKLGNRHQF